MNLDSEEYLQLIELHLSALTIHGLDYMQKISAAIDLLSSELDAIGQASEEKAEVITILKNSVRQHTALIEYSINERKQKFGQG